MAKPSYSKSKSPSYTDFHSLIPKFKKQDSTPTSIRSLLKSIDLNPVIALEYESSLILKQTYASLVDTIKTKLPEMQVIKIQGDTLNADKILDELCVNICTKTFFASDTLYLIADAKKLKDKSLEKLISAGETSENSWCIISMDSIPQNKLWKGLFDATSTFSLKNPTGDKLSSWVSKQAKDFQLDSINPDAISYLIQEHEGHPEKISLTLDKASLLLPIGATLDLSSLKNILLKGMHKDVFDLFNAIAKKDRLLTSLILDRVIDEGSHPLQIVALISKSLRSVAGALSKTKEVSPDISNPWMLKKLPINLFSEERAVHGLKILAELDSGLKGRNYGEEEFLSAKLLSI